MTNCSRAHLFLNTTGAEIGKIESERREETKQKRQQSWERTPGGRDKSTSIGGRKARVKAPSWFNVFSRDNVTSFTTLMKHKEWVVIYCQCQLFLSQGGNI